MESNIPLGSLLPELDPSRYKLHCAVFNGTEQPLNVFARSWEEWIKWNSWRPSKNVFNRDFIFSLMQIPGKSDHWIFGGVFEVLERSPTPDSHAYRIAFRPEVLPGQVGRLKVGYQPSGRNLRLNFEGAIERIEVIEILPAPFSGAPFPGHDQINLTLGELATVYEQNRSDWRHALEHMKGVYVLHDQITGKPYVGSACGDTGIWARWGQYVESLHGQNAGLRDLVDREGHVYARENLTFALLEFWSMRTADEYVLERESFWKDVLMSRRFGHNRN